MHSSAVHGVSRPKRPTSDRRVSAVSRVNSSRRARTYSVSTAVAGAALRATERGGRQDYEQENDNGWRMNTLKIADMFDMRLTTRLYLLQKRT